VFQCNIEELEQARTLQLIMTQGKAQGAPGAAIYSRLLLAVYDFWVLGISNAYAWRCSTKKVLLPFFRQNVRYNHLDIGVGTGYYLANADLPSDTKITLLDLNRNSLDAANRRIGGRAVKTLQHDVFEPLPMDSKHDSISLFYLLHCMPGPIERKTSLLANLKRYLSPDGVLYGCTILGKGVKHNAFGTYLMNFYNRKGIFGNWTDSEDAIVKALKENFEEVDVRVEGVVLLFTASRPKTDGLGTRRAVKG
jgi:ubiquinone/menaquinone biosynthesis C-methylase UbiE